AEEIPAKPWLLREVDNALQGDAEELNDDHMAIGLERPTRRWSEPLRLTSLDIDAEHLSDFVAEDAGFGAAVGILGGLNLFPSERDHQWDFYPVGGSVDVIDTPTAASGRILASPRTARRGRSYTRSTSVSPLGLPYREEDSDSFVSDVFGRILISIMRAPQLAQFQKRSESESS